MDNEEAKQLYYQAIENTKTGDYESALGQLERIEADRPNSRHVTYQRAICLVKLNRLEEARNCALKIADKMEPERMDELHGMLRDAAVATAAPESASQADSGENALAVESVFAAGADQTTVTGHVTLGVFRTGDTVTVMTPSGAPTLAPIVRIGTAETPLNLVRAGQQAVLVLHIESNLVTPGSQIVSQAREEHYAETMVVDSEPAAKAAPERAPELAEAERLLRKQDWEGARQKAGEFLAENPNSWLGYRLLARIGLEHDKNAEQALEHIRRAYELGGAEDPAVIDTLSQALAAKGEAEQGLRFLERLHGSDMGVEAQMALAQRIHEFRSQHGLGHVWEFTDTYGDVVFEAREADDIAKAIKNNTIPKDAKCRKDHIGEWRQLEEVLRREFPEIAGAEEGKSKANLVFLALAAVLVMAIVAAVVYFTL